MAAARCDIGRRRSGCYHPTKPWQRQRFEYGRSGAGQRIHDSQQGAEYWASGIWIENGASPVISHNRISGNSMGTGVHSNIQGALVLNNIIAHNRGVGCGRMMRPARTVTMTCGVTILYQGAVIGEGDLAVDPLFVDRANGDYQLSPQSPLLDSGDPDAQYNDLDGTRNELGAYGGPWAGATLPQVTVAAARCTDDGQEAVVTQRTAWVAARS